MPPQAPITQLRRAISGLTRKAALAYDIAKDLDYEAAVSFFVEMYDLRRTADDMLGAAQQRLVELTSCSCGMPDGNHENTCDLVRRFKPRPLPGSGVLKFGGGKERTRYDQPAIVSRLAAGIAEQIWEKERIAAIVSEDGEPMESRWEAIVAMVARTMADATGAMAPSFDSWRSGIAKQFGIKLKDYADEVPSPVTVRIEGRNHV